MPTLPLSKTSMMAIAAAALTASAAFLIGPRPDRPAPATAEEVAAAGAQSVEVIDPLHDRPFEVSTWEPAADRNGSLIIISHGFDGDRTSHEGLAADLAANGFTVAAPTHPDRAWLESSDPRLDPLVLRPRHLSLTIDAMNAPDEFDQVIVIGHSLGGYAALRLAGANPSGEGSTASGLGEHCSATPDDEVLCNPTMEGRIDRLIAGNSDFSEDDFSEEDFSEYDFSDARVDTIVLLAPAYGPIFSSIDLAGIHTDSLVVEARADDQLPGAQVAVLAAGLPDRTETTMVDGGHFVFLRACTEEEKALLAELCTDEGVDREAVHSDVVATMMAFVGE